MLSRLEPFDSPAVDRLGALGLDESEGLSARYGSAQLALTGANCFDYGIWRDIVAKLDDEGRRKLFQVPSRSTYEALLDPLAASTQRRLANAINRRQDNLQALHDFLHLPSVLRQLSVQPAQPGSFAPRQKTWYVQGPTCLCSEENDKSALRIVGENTKLSLREIAARNLRLHVEIANVLAPAGWMAEARGLCFLWKALWWSSGWVDRELRDAAHHAMAQALGRVKELDLRHTILIGGLRVEQGIKRYTVLPESEITYERNFENWAGKSIEAASCPTPPYPWSWTEVSRLLTPSTTTLKSLAVDWPFIVYGDGGRGAARFMKSLPSLPLLEKLSISFPGDIYSRWTDHRPLPMTAIDANLDVPLAALKRLTLDVCAAEVEDRSAVRVLVRLRDRMPALDSLNLRGNYCFGRPDDLADLWAAIGSLSPPLDELECEDLAFDNDEIEGAFAHNTNAIRSLVFHQMAFLDPAYEMVDTDQRIAARRARTVATRPAGANTLVRPRHPMIGETSHMKR